MGLTEPGGAERPHAAKATTGSSTGRAFITQGSIGGCVVLAQTSAAATRLARHHLRRRARYAGVRIGACSSWGCRASSTAELTLDGVRVSDAQRVGEIDQGFSDTMRILDLRADLHRAAALGLGFGAGLDLL